LSVEAQHLTKTFRRLSGEPTFASRIKAYLKRNYEITEALKDVSFSIKPGEKVTLLGPNGAGKSTIIKILTGIIYPNSGIARVNSIDPQKHRYEATYQFGVVFGHRTLSWRHISVIESLKLHRDVYELDKPTFK